MTRDDLLRLVGGLWQAEHVLRAYGDQLTADTVREARDLIIADHRLWAGTTQSESRPL